MIYYYDCGNISGSYSAHIIKRGRGRAIPTGNYAVEAFALWKANPSRRLLDVHSTGQTDVGISLSSFIFKLLCNTTFELMGKFWKWKSREHPQTHNYSRNVQKIKKYDFFQDFYFVRVSFAHDFFLSDIFPVDSIFCGHFFLAFFIVF